MIDTQSNQPSLLHTNHLKGRRGLEPIQAVTGRETGCTFDRVYSPSLMLFIQQLLCQVLTLLALMLLQVTTNLPLYLHISSIEANVHCET